MYLWRIKRHNEKLRNLYQRPDPINGNYEEKRKTVIKKDPIGKRPFGQTTFKPGKPGKQGRKNSGTEQTIGGVNNER